MTRREEINISCEDKRCKDCNLYNICSLRRIVPLEQESMSNDLNNGNTDKEEKFDLQRFISEHLELKEKSFPKDDSDYWTRLEHQAAIAAMQGILSNHNLYGSVIQMTQVSRVAIDYAQELVEKMKNQSV